MENYNDRLDNLFTEWQAASAKNGHTGFCSDGLMFRGSAFTYDGGKGKYPGDEDELWEKCHKRILFLLKDSNNNPDCDTREFYPGSNGTIGIHYKNIAFWYYGLLSFTESTDAPDFADIDFWEDVYPVFDQGAIAIVNCKKQSGGASISADILSEHINIYADFIRREIEILNPDIIVCGGGSSSIKNLVAENIYADLEKINNWIYYDRKNNKVVIDSYRPSHRYSTEEVYSDMMSAYKEFLSKHPDFRKNIRKTCEAVRAGLNNNFSNTMGLFKKNALEIITKELQAEFGKKLQVKNCEYEDGRNYVQFWFEPYDKWVEIWNEDDKLTLYLASQLKSDEGYEVGGITFANREYDNVEKRHWYSADGHFAYELKSEAELSVLVADAVAVLNDLIKYNG
jgi:hypothetical protein